MASATAHGREERDFVAMGKLCVPSREFLVARSHQRGAKSGKIGKAPRIALEEIGNGGAFGQFLGFFAMTGQFADAAEEKHLHSKSRRDLWHLEIVT